VSEISVFEFSVCEFEFVAIKIPVVEWSVFEFPVVKFIGFSIVAGLVVGFSIVAGLAVGFSDAEVSGGVVGSADFAVSVGAAGGVGSVFFSEGDPVFFVAGSSEFVVRDSLGSVFCLSSNVSLDFLDFLDFSNFSEFRGSAGLGEVPACFFGLPLPVIFRLANIGAMDSEIFLNYTK
jgi:hypothetical protein